MQKDLIFYKSTTIKKMLYLCIFCKLLHIDVLPDDTLPSIATITLFGLTFSFLIIFSISGKLILTKLKSLINIFFLVAAAKTKKDKAIL